MRALNIAGYFKRYAWTHEQVDAQVWRSTFATEDDEEFDLYVMVDETWVHFAVSPFLSQPPAEHQPRLLRILLRLNQQMRLVYFALDEDGDVNLLTELPMHGFAYAHFSAALDALVDYTNTLAHDLARIAHEPTFHSAIIPVE